MTAGSLRAPRPPSVRKSAHVVVLNAHVSQPRPVVSPLAKCPCRAQAQAQEACPAACARQRACRAAARGREWRMTAPVASAIGMAPGSLGRATGARRTAHELGALARRQPRRLGGSGADPHRARRLRRRRPPRRPEAAERDRPPRPRRPRPARRARRGAPAMPSRHRHPLAAAPRARRRSRVSTSRRAPSPTAARCSSVPASPAASSRATCSMPSGCSAGATTWSTPRSARSTGSRRSAAGSRSRRRCSSPAAGSICATSIRWRWRSTRRPISSCACAFPTASSPSR